MAPVRSRPAEPAVAAAVAPGAAAPAVVAVIVTRDPGGWFTEALRSLAAQTYRQLSVLVIDAGSAVDPSPRIAAILPEARIKRLDANPGYGAATNTVLDVVEGAAFYLLCHDDVALDPDAVRLLVEEAFRSNGGVLGPKLVDWDDPRRIRSVGLSVDKTGVPAPFAEPGELDQEQHDAVRDVFAVAGGATLVRADLFATIGGFDPAMTFHGDDVDLCWRAHVAGGRVVIVPSAVARHLEALGARRRTDDRRRLQQRHRVRTLLTAYRPWHLARVAPQALALTAIEAVVAVLGGRLGHASDLLRAWAWNLSHLTELARRRRRLAKVRLVRDVEVRDLQVRGSARFTAFLRGQRGSSDDRLGRLAATGRELSTALRAPLSRVAVGAAAVTLLLMALGSRNLIARPLPAVGEMSAFPRSALDLVRAHASGWRTTGGGGPGPSPTGVGGFGLLSLLALGSTSVVRKVAILALLPAGPLGIWRLTRPIGSIRAGAVAIVVYAAIPVPYNALTDGAWSALAVYAAVPWILLGLARVMDLAPFGRTDLPEDAAVAAPPRIGLVAGVLSMGLVVALTATVTLAVVPLVGVVAAGLVVGSVAAGRRAGLGRLLVAAVGAVVVAIVLHLPWSAGFLAGEEGWDAAVATLPPAGRTAGELLRFQTGPFGNSPAGWAFLVAAALPLVIGRGWRLAWAVRAWFVALAAWGVLLAGEQGHLGVDLPRPEVLLVPAAAGLALSTALGVAAFEVDLRHYRFGGRQAASVVAALALAVGGATLAPGVVDGRWKVPARDLNRPLAPTLVADGDRQARVLWLGEGELVPAGSHAIGGGGIALATTDGLPDVRSRWAGRRHRSTDRLATAVGLATSRRTVHLGRLLAPEGVRYIVVPTRSVPVAAGGFARTPPTELTDALAAQIELERVAADRSLLVYRNTAWRGVATAVAAGVDLPSSSEGAAARVPDDDSRSVVVGSSAGGSYRVRVPADVDVVAAVPANSRWRLEVDGRRAPASDRAAYGWAARFDDPGQGSGQLVYDTAVDHRAFVVAQPALWVVALGLRSTLAHRARRRRRLALAPALEVDRGSPVDPVVSAAEAVAGLAARATAKAEETAETTSDRRTRRERSGRSGRRRRRSP